MPQLHARGVDLVVDLLDASDHVERLTPREIRTLLREAASVLGELEARYWRGTPGRRSTFEEHFLRKLRCLDRRYLPANAHTT